ncbi:SRPBCC family protein [Erythrobacter rubeus]|uniref:SRPBCC family protein n=1 Tax=Erythrobacter rubeus TaxID=2760803 RepID=A0ABR8KUW3_9SPHN|nr:SRPBCC family protein [Erythrobacter rubeus]MBD2842021.1 SRPBCC family protein [Erythrobacter rubeus]
MSDYGRQTGPAQVEFTRIFDAAPARVWEFLVDGEKRKLWFCGGSTDDHAGGEIVFEFDHRRLSDRDPPEKYASEEIATHRGRIIEYCPPHRLVFTWFEAEGEGESTVDITLRETDGGKTELHLVHTGLAGRDMLVGVLAGWHGHFDLLCEVVNGPRKSDFWARDGQLEKEYAARV